MEIAVHVGVRERRHELALVLFFEFETLVAFEGVALALADCALHLLHLELNLSEVVEALAALLLLLLAGTSRLLLLLWLLLLC